MVATIRTERDLDNPVARVLVLADRALRSLLPVQPTWRPSLTGEVLSQLRAVVGSQPEMPDLSDLRRVRYTPITQRFRSFARLSHEIAHRRGHLSSASSADASGVLIDVAELWELFLVHCARRAFGPTRVEHGTIKRDGTHLLQSIPKPDKQLGRLKPGILVRDRLARSPPSSTPSTSAYGHGEAARRRRPGRPLSADLLPLGRRPPARSTGLPAI